MNNPSKEIDFSVIMPAYNQATFICRAINSLMMQSHHSWELIIVNDGSTDETEEYISDFLKDKRIHYYKFSQNRGLGEALNFGMHKATYNHIAYLPADDFFFKEHLSTLSEKLKQDKDIILAFSGMQYATRDSLHNYSETECLGVRSNYCLQLVQVAHKKTHHQWLTRSEYVTEDLNQMYWQKLLDEGNFCPTNEITCYWTSHPWQRHKIVSEKHGGGLNKYRAYYKIESPIRLRVSKNKITDETILQQKYPICANTKSNGLRILIVGELAYNAERIVALEQSGCKLYGLWTPIPEYSFSTVGPLPFGNIETIQYENLEKQIKEIKPDIIYALLNAGAVPFVYDIVKKYPIIPYVWHFKEGPSLCLHRGYWDKLIYLYMHAAGRIYLNKLTETWYSLFLPKSIKPSILLDGDLPKQDYFKASFSAKLSDNDGEIHTLVAGRMIGISVEDFKLLANNHIHIHLYNENYEEANTSSTPDYIKAAPDYFHIHKHVAPENWTEEFSKYDAGWLHCYNSMNGGNILQLSWDDMNIPARISTYASAGLPMICKSNAHNLVASNEILQNLDIGIFYNNIDEIVKSLHTEMKTRRLTKNIIRQRYVFSFDYHVEELLCLFHKIINSK